MSRLALQLLLLPTLCLLAKAQAPASPDSPRAAAIKARLQEILRSPDYETAKPAGGALEGIGRSLGDALRRFGQWLEGVIPDRVGGGGGGSVVLLWIILGALVVGLAYVIVFAVRRVGLRAPAAKRKKPEVREAPDEPEEATAADMEAWLDTARRLASSGDFRCAYRAAFVALLLRLDRMGAIRFDRARTNGEYLRALRDRPRLRAFLRPLANDFDARWYGRRPVAEPDYRRLVEAFDTVESAEPSGGQA